MTNNKQTLREEEHMRLHMLALSKAENAKDIGDCTVVRMGYVVKMLEEELQAQRTADLEALREGVGKMKVDLPTKRIHLIKTGINKSNRRASRWKAEARNKALSDTLSLIEQIMNKKI